MNFALILLVCMVISGFFLIIDKLYLAKQLGPRSLLSKLIEQVGSFFSVFVLVFVLRSFIIEPFRIPSSSLEPTLLVGDFVAVNKFNYGLRFPVLDKKMINIGEPSRGDVVVFSWPPNEKFDYIKRVIGLPGDKIGYHNKVLTVNGVVAKQSVIKMTSFIDGSGKLQSVELREEDLEGVKHKIYINPANPVYDLDVTVPADNYFVMGDNRDHSGDSRYWGFVPNKNLRGRAFIKWMSWDSMLNRLRWSRIGRFIV